MIYQGFQLDLFQEKAVRAIDEGKSLIVAAPTGCGKTLIAEYAVDVSINLGKRVIYTAPIKALSNQKFRDFRRRFGEERVGIHTGDVSINQDAQLLIMTTEIFRNLILENSIRLADVYYTVFDEIHYLDDPQRGTVWEESIILAPPHIRFMCLSATVPNINELAQWIWAVRSTEIEIIEEKKRPVPLRHFLFSPKFGFINIKRIRKLYRRSPKERKKFHRRKPSSRRIVEYVVSQRQIPALYFCFNRRACERNAEMHIHMNLLTSEEKQKVRGIVDELVKQYSLGDYERLRSMRRLWEAGCGYHHAGILPGAKEIVERLFTAGLIKLLFCTETFSLGINMPAAAVIFDELEKFNGVDFEYLMTRQYHQMAGRAGRRGMDDVGYVYSQIVPEATDPEQLQRILYGQNERIQSRFFASYATILSLYSQFGEEAFEIFRRSLCNFKKGMFQNTKLYMREERQIRNRIAFLKATNFLDGTTLTDKGKLAMAVNGYEIQAAEIYFSRCLEDCSVNQLPVIFAALITEDSKVKAANASIYFRFDAEKVIRNLRKKEIKFGIEMPIKEMNFAFAPAVFAWANGCSLKELEAFKVPEGDFVRVVRMAIQLLRTMRDNVPDPEIADRMHEAILLINRDVVDAQAELEAGI